jgi:hypothetical protein
VNLQEALMDIKMVGFAVGLLLFLMVAVAVVRALFRKPKEAPVRDEIPNEDLSEYPRLPTALPRISVHGVPVRVRLVVVAPVGKGNTIDPDAVPMLLEKLVHGLGAAATQDRARIRVWPAQLSNQGFSPVFHNHVHSPDAEGKPSRWVLLAGPTPARPKPLLLGLALQAAEPTSMGRQTVPPEQWNHMLHMMRQ